MARKPAEDPLSKLARTMVVSAQQVWFSSLSSVLKAQQEIGQQVTELFALDDSSGVPAQRPAATGGVNADGEALTRDTVQALAEHAFETHLVPLLQRGDVASRTEIERLTREVAVLTRRVETLCRGRQREGAND
jgi:hypothetical protein